MYYIVIGSSRGLGAALVDELLEKGADQVIGVSRTKREYLEFHEKRLATDRYRYIELDITSPKCEEDLISVCAELPHEPLCVIFNAALQGTDVTKDHTLNYQVFEEVNRIGITGFYNVIGAVQGHLLTCGGMFVGISCIGALIPPVFAPRVAYPSSKAYLDMVLRCLRVLWRGKVKVVTVRLGHMHDATHASMRGVLTYSNAAKKIIQSISGQRIPNEINYPLSYTIMYRYIFAMLPDSVYVWLMRLLLIIRNFVKKKPADV